MTAPPFQRRRPLEYVGGLALLGALVAGAAAVLMIRGGFSARDEPSALEAMVARSARLAGIPARMRALRNPVAASPAVIAAALVHWAGHCAPCHANDGSGQTPMGRGMFPRAPEMRRGPSQELSDGQLYGIIKEGIRMSGMPAWGEPGDADEETWGLVAFIRHLPQLSQAELEALAHHNPKTPHQLAEEREEDAFLRGEAPESPPHPHQEKTP